MTDAAQQHQPSAIDLLEEAASRIVEPGWEPFATEAIAAAKRRLAELTPRGDLEAPLHLAHRLIAGRFTVGSALAIIDALPDRGVNQLAFVAEDAEVVGQRV